MEVVSRYDMYVLDHRSFFLFSVSYIYNPIHYERNFKNDKILFSLLYVLFART